MTAHPVAEWTAPRIVEAFPNDEAPRFLIRDRDRTYGNCFDHRVAGLVSDGDLFDLRFVSTAQTMTNTEAFIEQLEERKR